MSKLTAFVKPVINWAGKNQAVIKAVLAGIGVITTGVTAARAGMAAKERISEKEELIGEELTIKEKIEETWTLWIPPFLAGATSIFCIYSGTRASLKSIATVGALYSASQQNLNLTKEALSELEGPHTLKKVLDRANEKKEEASPIKEVIYTGTGEHLCFDPQSGRYFKTNYEKVRSIQNQINQDVLTKDILGFSSLNDFYFLLGLESIPLGEDMGWTPEYLLDIYFTSKITDDGEPCMVLDYEVFPKYMY